MKRVTALTAIGVVLSVLTKTFVCASPGVDHTNHLLRHRGFVENRGQIGNAVGSTNASVLFLISYGDLSVTLSSRGISLYTSRLDVSDPSCAITERVDVVFVNASSECYVLAEEPLPGYDHYYTTTTRTETALFVRSFQRVRYIDLYPNIDLLFRLTEAGDVEYDFIVRPGGRVSDIAMQYRGSQSVRIENNSLVIPVENGYVTESLPSCYQAGSLANVPAQFVVRDSNVVCFDVGDYNTSDTLIIDPLPIVIWYGIFGAYEDDRISSLATDDLGNIYVVGTTRSKSGIATSGSHRSEYMADDDAFVIKLDSNGSRIWGTYLGGFSNDRAKGVTVSRNGDITVVGETYSTDNVFLRYAHQRQYGGRGDAMIACLRNDGSLRWGTFLGGSERDGAHSVATTPDGNVVLAGSTESPNGIASVEHEKLKYRGSGDGFIAMFDSTGKRLWGRYIGGTKWDGAYGIACSDRSIYVCGGSKSEDAFDSLTLVRPRALKDDGFVASYAKTGLEEWGTFVGGNSYDTAYCISVDARAVSLLVGGATTSSTGIASSDGADTTLADSIGGTRHDGFLIQLSATGEYRRGTYVGDTQNEVVTGVVQHGGSIFIAGTTASSSGVATASTFDNTFNGSTDVFVARYSSISTKVWCTYLGSQFHDEGSSLAVSATGGVVVGGFVWGNAWFLGGSNLPVAQPIPVNGQFAPTGRNALIATLRDCAPLEATIVQEYPLNTQCITDSLILEVHTSDYSPLWIYEVGMLKLREETRKRIVLTSFPELNRYTIGVRVNNSCGFSDSNHLDVIWFNKFPTIAYTNWRGVNRDTFAQCLGDPFRLFPTTTFRYPSLIDSSLLPLIAYSWARLDTDTVAPVYSDSLTTATPGTYVLRAELPFDNCMLICDTLTLKYHDLISPVIVLQSNDTLICTGYNPGRSYSYNWKYRQGAVWEWLNQRDSVLHVTKAGEYRVVVEDTTLRCSEESATFIYVASGTDSDGTIADSEQLRLYLYPTPASGFVQVHVSGGLNYDLRVVDPRTSEVLINVYQTEAGAGLRQTLLSVESLAPGMYWIAARSGRSVTGRPLLVVR